MFTEQILIFFDSGFHYGAAGASPSVSQREICYAACDEKGGGGGEMSHDVIMSPSAGILIIRAKNVYDAGG